MNIVLMYVSRYLSNYDYLIIYLITIIWLSIHISGYLPIYLGFVSDLFEFRPNFEKYFLESEAWRLKRISVVWMNQEWQFEGLIKHWDFSLHLSPISCSLSLRQYWKVSGQCTEFDYLHFILNSNNQDQKEAQDSGSVHLRDCEQRKFWEDLNILNIDFPEAALHM